MRSFLMMVLVAGCGGAGGTPMDPGPGDARVVQVVAYAPGPAWDQEKPADEQDLAAHLGFVGEEHEAGRLVANGLMTTAPRGHYWIVGDAAVATSFVDRDPAIDSGVLVHESTESWLLAIDGATGQLSPGQVAFVLRYRPGEAWEPGKPLTEQAVADHMAYIESAVGQGVVLSGGPIDGGDAGGMYLVSAADHDAALAFANADPGVASGLFAPSVDGWQLMNTP